MYKLCPQLFTEVSKIARKHYPQTQKKKDPNRCRRLGLIIKNNNPGWEMSEVGRSNLFKIRVGMVNPDNFKASAIIHPSGKAETLYSTKLSQKEAFANCTGFEVTSSGNFFEEFHH